MEGETGLGSEPQALSLHSKLSCVLSPVPSVIYFHNFEDEISLTSGQELSAHRKDLPLHSSLGKKPVLSTLRPLTSPLLS